jgi:hypothetical protein
MATQITFDGTIEHLNEDLMLSFDFTNNATDVRIVCDPTVFNLNYEHIGCTDTNMPNDTKIHKKSNLLANPQTLKTLGYFF